MRKGVAVSIIDLGTIRQFNLYAELMAFVGQSDPTMKPDSPHLYAATCRYLLREPQAVVGKAILAVVACVIAGAVIGAGIGYSLGRFAPAYYRSVFRNGNAPGFDPVQVGTGLGLTQGVALGFITGIVIVIVLMRRTRKAPA